MSSPRLSTKAITALNDFSSDTPKLRNENDEVEELLEEVTKDLRDHTITSPRPKGHTDSKAVALGKLSTNLDKQSAEPDQHEDILAAEVAKDQTEDRTTTEIAKNQEGLDNQEEDEQQEKVLIEQEEEISQAPVEKLIEISEGDEETYSPVASKKHGHEVNNEDRDPVSVKRRRSSRLQTLQTEQPVRLDQGKGVSEEKQRTISPNPRSSRQPSESSVADEVAIAAWRPRIQHPPSRQQLKVFKPRSRRSINLENASRSTKSLRGNQSDSDNSSDEDDVFAITVYKVPKSAGGTTHINAIDIVRQAVDDIFEKFLASSELLEDARPALRRALSQLHVAVKDRLLALVDMLDSNYILANQLRTAKLKRDKLRDQLLALRDERLKVQTQIEVVRKSYVEQTTNLNRVRELDFFLADLDNLKEIAKAKGPPSSADTIDDDAETPDDLLNKVLLDLDLLSQVIGPQGALQALEHTVTKLEYLDQHLAFS